MDPVGAGFVNSLARPGGNVTGFALFEYSISGNLRDVPVFVEVGEAGIAVHDAMRRQRRVQLVG
jgi:putative ABC transport system substrate-binding protein